VQRRGWRRCASTEHEDVRLQHVERCGRRAGVCRIERQSLDATNVRRELSKPGLMPRYCEYARAVAHAALDDLSSDAAAPPNYEQRNPGRIVGTASPQILISQSKSFQRSRRYMNLDNVARLQIFRRVENARRRRAVPTLSVGPYALAGHGSKASNMAPTSGTFQLS